MRKSLLALTALAFAVGSSAACATKGYVNQQVSQVSGQVDSLSQSLEETQQATRENAGRIVEVDGKAGAAQQSADRAGEAARTADGKAVAAGNAARAVDEKADAIDAAMKRIIYEVVLSEDQGNFKFNDATLPDEAKAAIDEMIGDVLADPQGAYFEIEGHTDNVGTEEVNKRVGLQRAESVKRYLYEQHHIPLHKMNVISFGEEKPMSPNTTREGRAQNRRVVIRVVA